MDQFTITLGCCGTITLSEAALRNYPTSLLTQKLLPAHVSSVSDIQQRTLDVPITCGLDYFPGLIKEIFNCNSPSQIPPPGVQFDLFVKWLKYLNIATVGRQLSTECSAAKRVSFFVEVMLNTLRTPTRENLFGKLPICKSKVRCSGIQAHIERYMYDIIPFEFARRGFHVTIKELAGGQLVKGDLDMSKLKLAEEDEGKPACTSAGDRTRFRLKPSSTTGAKNVPGTVTGVYYFNASDEIFTFSHKGCDYQLAGKQELRIPQVVTLTQIAAGSCHDGRSTCEDLLLIPVWEDGKNLAADFEANVGVLSYNADEASRLTYLYTSVCNDRRSIPLPLVHGVVGEIFDMSEDNHPSGAFLVVVESESQPALSYVQVNDKEALALRGKPVYEFCLDETPAWALESSVKSTDTSVGVQDIVVSIESS